MEKERKGAKWNGRDREREQRDQAASAPTEPPPYHLQHSQPAYTVAAAPRP